MMKTRRKSKAATAAAADSPAEAGPSQATDEPHLTVFIPDDIELDSLSDLLPGTNFSSPSSEAILALYRLLLAQAQEGRSITQELDEARAEVEKKDVELDQALQDKESSMRELESSLDKAHDELNRVKQERDQLDISQLELQGQVSALSSSQYTSTTEVDTLKHRVEDTEREKRDLVGVISRIKQESSQQEEEIKTLRANLKEARQEHQNLEVQLRELRSTDTSSKFKLDSLSQQLQLSQAEVERTNAELTSKAEEFSKYRRAKHAELSAVQSSYDSLTQAHTSTQATLKTLQSAHTALTHQATQASEKIQSLTSQLAEQEATYASEASGLRRLVAMMEEREKQAKEIVETIEKEWASVGEKSERREATLREEVEREKKGREIAEKRADQMEGILDRMGRGELPILQGGVPGTPIRTPGSADRVTDGMMGLSPTVAMASKAQRSGKTFTEVYADYVRLQDDFGRKSAEYDHMDRTLSAVLAQIEERAPILSQQRAEYERLQSEASQLASQLAQALSERDLQASLAQENTQKLSKSTRENELLQKQLTDLGRQLQSLLREISRRDDPTIPSDEDLDSAGVAPAEDTESVITNNLVLFRSIDGLQEQNQKLLKIVRELGRKMESEERDYRDAMEREQGEAVKEAHEAMQELATQLERQKKSSESIIQAYVKERDTLRSMLARAEKATGSGVVSSTTAQMSEIGAPQTDAARELAEIQSQFEAYRMEMGIDSGKLREDLITAQREVGQLGAALAKANARYEFLNDRYRMSQDQFAMQGRELEDLSKRNQQLFDQWSRVDIECTHATEELQIAAGRIEQLRNECANLRAEKKIWESVQARLVEENKTVQLERSHLSDLMVNVQKMHNDLERSGENDRRRLENQLHILEVQTQDLRTQVSQERDSVRHISLQKDIELKELQTRLEKATQDFSKTRESLVGAETSKKHLEERVEELNRKLQGNEEKLAVYERRSSVVNGVAQHLDPDMNREQQLEAEVAELRSSLKVTEVDLATARSHVQQFQEISQANEEALANLHATYDEYRISTEAHLTRHESEYKALQEKLQTAEGELAQLTTKYNELQKTFEAERTAWTNDKKTLEDTIVDMSTSEKHSESDRESRESEVRQQEERAKAAEDRYSNEVVAHAESIKAIETLKRDLASAQGKARDNLSAAETAKANLSTSENSWKQQREALDKEVADLNARCQDLSSQNAILHQHLESVSSQANRIKVAASSTTTGGGDSQAIDGEDTKLSELRSVVAYLRKEKEIVDLQLELSKQEAVRLRAQVEHLSQTLNETRTTLSEERERAVETAASAAQHAELLERINQLNILRESNATLRTDCESYAKRSRELEVKLKQISQELDPAKEQARISQAELEASKGHLKRLEEENRRWQERNSQLLTKYDRIDPADVQALRDEIELLKTQKTEAEQKKEEAEKASTEGQERIGSQEKRLALLEKNLRDHKESIAKNSKLFKMKMGELNAQISALVNEKRDQEAKVAALEQENGALRNGAEKTPSPNTSSEELAKQAATITSLQEERAKLLVEKSSWTSQASTDNATPASGEAKRLWDAEKAELTKNRDEALAKLKTATEETHKVVEEARDLKRQNEKFQARITQMMRAKAQEDDRQAAAAEKPKTEQPNTAAQEDLVKKHVEELQLLTTKLTAKHQEELKAAVEAARNETAATNPPPDQSAAIKAAIAEHEKILVAKHAEEIASAVDRGRLEQQAKGKLKDSQLVRAQKKVKEYEAQIVEWRKAGLIPEPVVVAPAVPVTPTSTGPPTTPITTTAPKATPAPNAHPPPNANAAVSANPGANTNPPANAASASNPNPLPRKPPASTPTGPAPPGMGRGVGVGRGRVVQRGMAGAGLGRAAPKPAATPNPAGGMSIMGAAAKRPREDGAVSDDSLAKRLKPAAETPVKAPPVAIRRPPPGP